MYLKFWFSKKVNYKYLLSYLSIRTNFDWVRSFFNFPPWYCLIRTCPTVTPIILWCCVDEYCIISTISLQPIQQELVCPVLYAKTYTVLQALGNTMDAVFSTSNLFRFDIQDCQIYTLADSTAITLQPLLLLTSKHHSQPSCNLRSMATTIDAPTNRNLQSVMRYLQEENVAELTGKQIFVWSRISFLIITTVVTVTLHASVVTKFHSCSPSSRMSVAV